MNAPRRAISLLATLAVCALPVQAAPNLVVTSVTAPALAGDCSVLDAAGIVDVTIENDGPDGVLAGFDILVFEDLDGDDVYTALVDQLLGMSNVAPPFGAGATLTVPIDVVGVLDFRDAPVHAWVDSSSTEPEVDESDNFADSSALCARPPVGSDFDVVVEWQWREDDVATAPLVGDVNADGTPDIVFAAISNIIHVLDGRTGNEIWRTNDPMVIPRGQTTPALAELDGDPGLEVVALSGSQLSIWDDDGTLISVTTGLRTTIGFPVTGAVTLADMDCDGSPEGIFQHGAVRLSDGTTYWSPVSGAPGFVTIGSNSGYSGITTAADMDDDGLLEILAGPTAWTLDPGTGRGTPLWRNFDLTDGYSVPGQFDADAGPEVVIVQAGRVALVEGETGNTIWDVPLPASAGGCVPPVNLGGPPTIADFDGDGAAEIGVADGEWYVVLEADGTIKWQMPVSDCSSASTGSTVFDFDGDGAAEVVYQDEWNLHIFRGTDGLELASIPTSHGTIQEMPTIADVDGDGRAEIVAGMTEWGASRLKGLRVYGDANDNWVNARSLWNQHSYHVTNVNDDGTIPPTGNGQCQEKSWETHNTYRQQPPPDGSPLGQPDLTLTVLDWAVEPGATCGNELIVEARIGNGGAIGTAGRFDLWLYEGDPASGGRALQAVTVLDLEAGVGRTITMRVLIRDAAEYHLVLDDDGLGAGAGVVSECREDNNHCVIDVAVVPPNPRLPDRVGNALRATAHGDPYAAGITGTFSWAGDQGLPRPMGEHYHVLRSTSPEALAPVAGTHPWAPTSWLDSTPASQALPTCHYLLVVAADACEQVEPAP